MSSYEQQQCESVTLGTRTSPSKRSLYLYIRNSYLVEITMKQIQAERQMQAERQDKNKDNDMQVS